MAIRLLRPWREGDEKDAREQRETREFLREALHEDMILAARARIAADAGDTVIVATNPRHLEQLVDALEWRESV